MDHLARDTPVASPVPAVPSPHSDPPPSTVPVPAMRPAKLRSIVINDPPKPRETALRPEEVAAAEAAYGITPPPVPDPPAAPPAPDDARSDIDGTTLGLDEEVGSVGAAIQMLAVGKQNYFLDLNPQTTLFGYAHKRHTPFAIDTHADEFEVTFGRTAGATIERRGDLLGDVFLEVTLPALGVPGAWADAIGYVMLRRVRLSIDGVVVHDQERLWYDMADRLFLPHGRKACVDAMIGRGRTLGLSKPHTVVVPLKFACCSARARESRGFLPLAALATTARVRVDVDFEDLRGCVVVPDGTRLPRATARASVVSEQVVLDAEERRQVMRGRHEVMIHTQQDLDALTYTFDDDGVYDVSVATVDLRELNLPVKVLAFVAYDERDAVDGVYFRYRDCVARATLLVDGTERLAPRDGDYFSLVQTYQHARRCADDGVHAYSFALDAAANQPTGALNFAAVHNAALRVDLKNSDGVPIKIKAFAHCINWLDIDHGAAVLRFTGN